MPVLGDRQEQGQGQDLKRASWETGFRIHKFCTGNLLVYKLTNPGRVRKNYQIFLFSAQGRFLQPALLLQGLAELAGHKMPRQAVGRRGPMAFGII